MSNKKNYIEPLIEAICVTDNDVIATSCNGPDVCDSDNSDDTKLS